MTYSLPMKLCFAIVIALAPTVASAAPAAPASQAAPEYQSSEPRDGAELHEAPDEVTATFSEPLDPASRLAVTDECGKRVDDGNVEVFANEMSVGIERAPSGHYTVSYEARGLAGVTGSTRGRFAFHVHPGKSCDGGGHDRHGGDDDEGNGHDRHGGDRQRRGDHGSGNGHGGHDTAPEAHAGGHSEPGGHGTRHSGRHGRHGGSPHHEDQRGRGGHGEHGKHGGGPRNTDPSDLDQALGPSPVVAVPGGAGPSVAILLLALALAAGFGSVGGILLRLTT